MHVMAVAAVPGHRRRVPFECEVWRGRGLRYRRGVAVAAPKRHEVSYGAHDQAESRRSRSSLTWPSVPTRKTPAPSRFVLQRASDVPQQVSCTVRAGALARFQVSVGAGAGKRSGPSPSSVTAGVGLAPATSSRNAAQVDMGVPRTAELSNPRASFDSKRSPNVLVPHMRTGNRMGGRLARSNCAQASPGDSKSRIWPIPTGGS